ncbi:unnamed protein product [Arctogadus glacialis]
MSGPEAKRAWSANRMLPVDPMLVRLSSILLCIRQRSPEEERQICRPGNMQVRVRRKVKEKQRQRKEGSREPTDREPDKIRRKEWMRQKG